MSAFPSARIPDLVIIDDAASSSPSSSMPMLPAPTPAVALSSLPTSSVWDHFTRGKEVNKCKHCSEPIKVQPDGNTSNMRNHLKGRHLLELPSSRKKKRAPSPVDQRLRITSHFSSSSSSLTSSTPQHSIDKKHLTLLLLRMVIEMNVSFRGLTECNALKELLATTFGYVMPSRMTLRRLLPTYYTFLLNSLRTELLGVESLSITTDSTFLTRHQVPYVCITGHWIDENWELHSKVLSVFLAEQSETADYITTALRDVLETQLGLNRQVHCVVTDEGANFLTATEKLRKAEFVRESLRCACHRFQLTFKNAMFANPCKPLLALLEKCSNVTNKFKNGWMSAKRDILWRNQELYLEQLQKEISHLENEVSHGTRKKSELLEAKQAELSAAMSQLSFEKSERENNEGQRAAVIAETSELALVNDEATVPMAEDDDEIDEDGDELAGNVDLEAATLQKMTEKTCERLSNMKEYVDYIFRKRALVQKAATRWMTYVHVVKRTLMWRIPLMKSLDEIRADSTFRKKKKKDIDVEAEVNSVRISDDDANVLTQFLMVGDSARSVLESLESGNHTTIGSLLWHHSRLQVYLTSCSSNEEFTPMMREFCKLALDNSKTKFSADIDAPAMIAAVLDPRFRSLSFLSPPEAAKCRMCAQKAFVDLQIKTKQLTDWPPPPPSKKRKIGDFGADILDSVSPSKGVVSEFDRFIAQPNEPRTTDVLGWWKLHAGLFPTLGILARRYLAIPASSAASERLFSRLKFVATAARQNMSSDTLCMLLFVEQHLSGLTAAQ
ncbi:MAG: hAT transposon family protein [Ktedonobacteraceae bacterium]